MSDKQVKAERSKAKDQRQAPANDVPSNGKKRKSTAKDWIVLEKASDETIADWKGGYMPSWFKEWTSRGSYFTKEAAEQAVAHFKTQGYSLKYIYKVVHKDERERT